MQFLMTSKTMTLEDLADRIGERNVDSMINVNSLSRSVNIGRQFVDRAFHTSVDVDYQTKINILNTFVGSSDIYERAALGSERDWACLANYGSFSDAMAVPEDVILPSATDVLGNDESISTSIYDQCIASLTNLGFVDPSIFSQNLLAGNTNYGIINENDKTDNKQGNLLGQRFNTSSSSKISPFQNFKIPWGAILLYSSIDNTSMEIPAYPEQLSDGYKANLSEMPEMLSQYEPWQIYKSSGPRQQSVSFKLHRDMWTGDHTDGHANTLIRFCQANCFPKYDGASVHYPEVSLYINGSNYITGVMTDCKVDWEGPILSDGFYAAFTLSFDITEVSPMALNYNSVMRKGLIE